MNRFPNFGQDLQRTFEVHENCYDCGVFYDGCRGWRASREFDCREFNRLPDVGLHGRQGQEFPPARRRTQTQPEPIEQDPPENSRQTAPEADTVSTPTIGARATDRHPREQDNPNVRTCGCGVELPKGKRLCDTCRMENRRRTLRTYMQSYRKQASAAVVRPDQDGPFTANSVHAA